MKLFKSIILCSLGLATMSLVSCDDMLTKSERSSFELNQDFWNNANQVESYSNVMYEQYSGYGTGGGGGWFYFKSLSDDQVNPSFDNWMFTAVPGSSTYWSTPYTEIRRCNYLIEGLKNSTLSKEDRGYYMAVGRLNRAWQYYQLVRMYGDVQWINEVVLDSEADADVIYGARTDRDIVMDSVLADINFAIDYLPNTASKKNSWSVDMALAMKSDICLYEGTYCKYRNATDNGKAADLVRANKYLEDCATASYLIIMDQDYELTAEYGQIYNSIDLSSNKEIIFYRNYEKDLQMHSTIDYTASSSQQRGISKDAVDAFLFLDGKPRLLSSYTNKRGDNFRDTPELDTVGYNINDLLSCRDKRLSVLLDPYLCFKGHSWVRKQSMAMTSSTGYNIAKYDNPDEIEQKYRINTNSNYTDAPIFWLAVIYLNYAEAQAELGELDQDDLNLTLNKLQKRAGLPDFSLSPEADPDNNMGVSNLLWEIRRCRRCELMTDNWYRYWDLVRWHQLELLDTSKHPNIMKGAYFGNVDNKSEFTLDDEGYVIAVSTARLYDKKYYLNPIPSSQITLSNGKTTQNPGW